MTRRRKKQGEGRILTPPPCEPELSDEELRAKHGFDHCYAFRKTPTKRPPVDCKTGMRKKQ